jgi:microcystin-dependent protein
MTSLESSFKYSDFSITYPVGTIVSYMGITDPDGWIICDGVTRTGGAGRYAALKDILNASLGVSSNTQDSVTPPDLRSRLLYGKTDKNTVASALAGSSTVTLSLENMPSHKHDTIVNQGPHNHTITQTAHSHLATQGKHTHTATIKQDEGGTDTAVTAYGFNDQLNTWKGGTASGPYYGSGAALTVTINTAQPAITVTGAKTTMTLTGSSTAITVTETLKGSGTAVVLPVPPHFTANYIIKY